MTRRGSWELAIAGEAHLADPVTATFWNRDASFRVRHPVGGGDQCTVFRLTPCGSRALRERSSSRAHRESRQTFAQRTGPIDGPSYLLHRRVLEQARQAAADPLAIEETGLALLRRLAKDRVTPADQRPSREARRVVDRARDIIARDFLKRLTVESIAREAHCSPFHLSRLFRRATGITLYRAVVGLRLREGLERLLDQPGKLSTIALDTGFASHSHFTDAFRAEYGCPPSAARRWSSGRCR